MGELLWIYGRFIVDLGRFLAKMLDTKSGILAIFSKKRLTQKAVF